jgi:hypothetical protein
MFRIHTFDDFCLWMYVMIDDWYQQQALPKRPGPKPSSCSDSELLTMILVGECKGKRLETDLVDYWHERQDLFPRLPSLSRFNRRRRQLVGVLQALHQFMLEQMGWADDGILILDRVPIGVVSRAHAAHASSDWGIHQASYGYASTKRWRFYGYWLQVLMTYGGVILDWSLTAATTGEVAAAEDLLTHTPVRLEARLILADKGYISAWLQDVIVRERHARLLVLPRRGMRAAAHLPLTLRQRFARVRQRIETLNSQLADQFAIEQTTAHSFWGLCTRLRAKLTAHVCCVYSHWVSGTPLSDALRIKHLVFSS